MQISWSSFGYAIYVKNHVAIYFNGFGILKKIKKFIGNKTIKANIYTIQHMIQQYEDTFIYIRFINFKLNKKRLADFADVFSPSNFLKNEITTFEYFQYCINENLL